MTATSPETDATRYRLDDRVAIVTGAAQGIGLASARLLAARGATVVLTDISLDTTQQAIADTPEDARSRMSAVEIDVSDSDSVRSVFDGVVRKFGRLDIVHNNAGVAIDGSAPDLLEDRFDRVMDVNFGGVRRGCNEAIRHMRERGGAIVNTSSIQGHRGFDGWSGYAASKGAIDALTRQLAVEFAPAKIRINSVAPGAIWTPMNRHRIDTADDPDALMSEWVTSHPLGRLGESYEVAEAVAFLASDAAGFITGQTLLVDGGASVKG